ncbi:hypothetical protein [Weissella paramesenteroides]|jgi:hypothetical protein|uniref:hypothetical protein n=1 Tax=Lactobacillaceae TaxID=33958 RepID=UPI002E7B626D|nr:hypothetical protein [Weissella paramesenteroides]WPQ68993.1 hypothetical protein QRX23_10065 [Weissella paramesenteroides]
MKVKEFYDNSENSGKSLEDQINGFIEGKKVIDIKYSVNGYDPYEFPFVSALVMYEEIEDDDLEKEDRIQETSSTKIINLLSHAGYADLTYNERVLNGIEAVLIQLGYEVEDE